MKFRTAVASVKIVKGSVTSGHGRVDEIREVRL
jgi:hypothetical protein